MLEIGVFVFVVIYIFVKLWKCQIYWKKRKIPFEQPIPIFGIMLPFVLRKKLIGDIINKLYNSYSNTRYFGAHMFMKPVLIIRDPELVKQICIKDFQHFSERKFTLPESADPFFHKTLFATSEGKWKQMRPATTPVFTGNKIKLMFPLMDECARRFVAFFLNHDKNSMDVELKYTFTRYANDVITTTTFGIECDSFTQTDNEFYKNGRLINVIPTSGISKILLFNTLPQIMKALGIRMFPKRAIDYFSRAIDGVIKEREFCKTFRPDLIQTLLEANKKKGGISYDDIKAQALIFFIGGFETVATALSLTVYELAINQDVQKRLREEIDQCWAIADGRLSLEAVSRMKYMNMVIAESLRKHPPMFMLDRKCVRAYTIERVGSNEEPLRILPGEVCIIPSLSIHRDANYFPEPEKFDPERFSEENRSKIIPGTYLPFGVGPRSCIANRFSLLEIKTLIFHLLRNFEVVPNQHTQVPVRFQKYAVTMVAEKGFNVSFKRRHICCAK